MKKIFLVVVITLLLCSNAMAGIYSGPADTTNIYDGAIYKTDSSILEWADTVIDYSPAPGVSSSYQNPETGYGCLGDLTAAQIAEGVLPGSITVGFSTGIGNGDGADFAVFENGFTYGSPNGLFMELAYVEVSSNGTDFARFDSISTNTAAVAGSGGFSGWDTSNVYNLAGKNQSGYGTPFDLDELLNDPLVLSELLDLSDIQYVRLIDIPGTGDYFDSLGNPILDAHPTTGTGGYDFRLSEGVAVLNAASPVPVPGAVWLFGSSLFALIGIRRKK